MRILTYNYFYNLYYLYNNLITENYKLQFIEKRLSKSLIDNNILQRESYNK